MNHSAAVADLCAAAGGRGGGRLTPARLMLAPRATRKACSASWTPPATWCAACAQPACTRAASSLSCVAACDCRRRFSGGSARRLPRARARADRAVGRPRQPAVCGCSERQVSKLADSDAGPRPTAAAAWPAAARGGGCGDAAHRGAVLGLGRLHDRRGGPRRLQGARALGLAHGPPGFAPVFRPGIPAGGPSPWRGLSPRGGRLPRRLECQVSEMTNIDACPRPTTDGGRRRRRWRRQPLQ